MKVRIVKYDSRYYPEYRWFGLWRRFLRLDDDECTFIDYYFFTFQEAQKFLVEKQLEKQRLRKIKIKPEIVWTGMI